MGAGQISMHWLPVWPNKEWIFSMMKEQKRRYATDKGATIAS